MMKYFLLAIVFCFMFYEQCKGQDTIVKGDSVGHCWNEIYISEDDYCYYFNNKLIGERELNKILMDTKDVEIVGLVKASQRAHGLESLGFVAAPFFIAAVAFTNFAQSTSVYGANGVKSPSAVEYRKTLFIESGLFALIGISCPISTLVFINKRNTRTAKAIKIYNERY